MNSILYILLSLGSFMLVVSAVYKFTEKKYLSAFTLLLILVFFAKFVFSAIK
jgi:hypothetical protein